MVAASSHGLPPLWQIKPSDDGTTDHKEYASGSMPASIAGPNDELEIFALELPELPQQERTKSRNTKLPASHGMPKTLWQIKPSDDGTPDHMEHASGSMPASIAGPDDELEIILTTPYSVIKSGAY